MRKFKISSGMWYAQLKRPSKKPMPVVIHYKYITLHQQKNATPTVVDVTLMISPQLPDPHHQLPLLTTSLVVDKVVSKKLLQLSN